MHKVLGFIRNLVNYVSEFSLFHWSLIPLLVSPPTLSRSLSLSHVSWPPAQTPRRGQRGNWFRHLPGKSFQALTSWDQAKFKAFRQPSGHITFPVFLSSVNSSPHACMLQGSWLTVALPLIGSLTHAFSPAWKIPQGSLHIPYQSLICLPSVEEN